MADPVTRQPFQKPDGTVVTLEPQDFQAAQDRGYKPYDPAAKKPDYASDHPFQAAARKALDTVTLGLSTAALNGIEGGNKASKQLEEENPNASLAGQIGGFFLPGPGELAAGKAGLLAADAAKAAGAGKNVTRLAGGLANGGVWGLGSAINEDAMGDPGQAGEHYGAGILGGALAGGAANVVLGKFGDVGKSVLMKAFGGKAIQEKLADMAEEQVSRTIASPADDNYRNFGNRKNEIARQALDQGIVGRGTSLAGAADKAKAAASQAAMDVEVGILAADHAGSFVPDNALVRMQPIINEMDNNPAMSKIKDQVQEFANKFASESGEAPQTFKKAWETTQSMLKMVGTGEPANVKAQLWKLRGVLQDEIFQQANELNPGLGDQMQAANRQLANHATFEDLAREKAGRLEGNTDLYAVGGLALGGPVGLAKGMALGALKNQVKSRGGFALASALDAISQNKTFGRIADALQNTVKQGLESSPAYGGPFRAMLETASAEGAQKLLETHLRLANTEPHYAMYVNMPAETPGAVPEYADKAHRLAQIYGTVDDSKAAVDTSIKRFLGTQSGRDPGVKAASVSPKEFAEVKRKLEALQGSGSTPDAKLTEVAPGIGAMGSMTVQLGAKYLLDKAPKDPNENKPAAVQRPWEPGTDEMKRWSRCVAAIANPLIVMDQMRAGRVTPEALDAVKAVYPKIFQQFQDQLHEHLANMTSPLSRQRLDRVSQITGSEYTKSVDALIQNMHAANVPQGPPKGGSSPDGRQDVNAAKNQLTQAQRLEGMQDEKAS